MNAQNEPCAAQAGAHCLNKATEEGSEAVTSTQLKPSALGTKPARHSPQLWSVSRHGSRLRDAQYKSELEAPEQLARLMMSPTTDTSAIVSSRDLVKLFLLLLFDGSNKASTNCCCWLVSFTGKTCTAAALSVHADSALNTRTVQFTSYPLLLLLPDGNSEEVWFESDRVCSTLALVPEKPTKPNSYVNGSCCCCCCCSSTEKCVAEKKNSVVSATPPDEGVTTKTPPRGPVVVLTTIRSRSRLQRSKKLYVRPSDKVKAESTRLIVWFLLCGDDDDGNDDGDDSDGVADSHWETGTRDLEERSIDGSSTIHSASHGYLVSTVAVRTSFLLVTTCTTEAGLVVMRARPPPTKSAGVGTAVDGKPVGEAVGV